MKISKLLTLSTFSLLLIFSTKAFSRHFRHMEYMGKTGKFEKVIRSTEGLRINRWVTAVRIVATQDLLLERCWLDFGNGRSRTYDMSFLDENRSEFLHLRRPRFVEKVTCEGTSASLIGSRGRLEVYVASERSRRGRGRDRDRFRIEIGR